MIRTILNAIEFVVEGQGDPQSSYWLASQMVEMRMWRANEHDFRAALEKNIKEFGQRSQFVEVGDDEWTQREWTES